jgi:urea carboxylase
MTKSLSFRFAPSTIDVVTRGAYTLTEDSQGRPAIGRGFSHSGPMDPLAFQIAKFLVGNVAGAEGLEITLNGPDLKSLGAAIVTLCGGADGSKAGREALLDVDPCEGQPRLKADDG